MDVDVEAMMNTDSSSEEDDDDKVKDGDYIEEPIEEVEEELVNDVEEEDDIGASFHQLKNNSFGSRKELET